MCMDAATSDHACCLSAISPLPATKTGEFQEVVDAKLRHTHPRVQKQRAAAASLASTVASASALQSIDVPSQPPSDSEDTQQQQQQLVGSISADLQAAAAAAGAAAAAAVNEGIGIQVVHVVPWQDPSSSSSKSADDVLLEMDHVSINTPDGGLALVQDLSLKVHSGECVCVLIADSRGVLLTLCLVQRPHTVEPWGLELLCVTSLAAGIMQKLHLGRAVRFPNAAACLLSAKADTHFICLLLTVWQCASL
jgi:hypothetical protein